MDELQVLFADYNGHRRPLSLMYFSLDSRCLVADHPESVAEEVESHFCPTCNGLFTTPDAMSTENRCSSCYECPCCGAVLAPSPVSLEGAEVAGGKPLYCLQCLYCQWTSEDAGVVASDPASLAEVAAAVARKEKRGGGDGPSGSPIGSSSSSSSSSSSAVIVGALLKAAKQREAESLRVATAASARGGAGGGRLRSGSIGGGFAGAVVGTASQFSAASTAAAGATGPWKVADLEEAVKLRKQAVAAASRSPGSPGVAAADASAEKSKSATALPPPWTRRGDTAGPDPALWGLSIGHEAPGLAERVESLSSSPPPLAGGGVRGGRSGGGGEDAEGGARAGAAATVVGGSGGSEWCLRRVRLRTRLGKRCRKDLAAGRTGILIKATFNPLEGDSSTAKASRVAADRPVVAGSRRRRPKGVKKKWFKKDCSAALLVPKVTVAALPSSAALLGSGSDGDQGRPSGATAAGRGAGAPPPPPALVLRMVNPQQGTLLRLRVARDDEPPAAAEIAGSSGSGSGGADENPRQASGSEGVVAAAGGVARGVAASVVVVRPEGWKEGELLRLEGKEDEVLRQPGDRHRLPGGTLSCAAGGSSEDTPAQDSAAVGPPFLVHQQGDVAWVRVALDKASVGRVASAAAAAASTGASAKASLVVDVRFALVMAEGEEEDGGAGGASEDVSMPISVRFPLSRCPA